jgi:hypothetical protein
MYEVMMTYRIYKVVVDRCVPVGSSGVTVEVNASEEAHQLLGIFRYGREILIIQKKRACSLYSGLNSKKNLEIVVLVRKRESFVSGNYKRQIWRGVRLGQR